MFGENQKKSVPICLCFAAIIFITLSNTTVAASFQGEEASEIRRLSTISRPDPEGVPTKVTVGVYLLDILAVNELSQTFTADFFLLFSWKDTRLALDPSAASSLARTYQMEEIWHPFATIINERNLDRHYNEILRVDNQGNVDYVQRLQGELTNPLSLQEFPLDSQTLGIKISSIRYSPEEIEFINDENRSGSRGTFSLPGWDVEQQAIDVTTEYVEVQDRHVARIDFSYMVQRHVGHYIIKVIIPLVLIILMAWAVFFIPPSSLGPQIGLPTSSIFALFILMDRISQMLPRISYLTRMDIFILGAIILVFITLGEAIVTAVLALKEKKQLARKIDRWARFVYLGLFFIVLYNAFIR